MHRCYVCCLCSVIGTDLRSCVFTQTKLLRFLSRWRRTSVIAFVALPQILVLALRPKSYHAKLRLDDDAKGSKIRADLANLRTLHHMPNTDNGPRGSICKHTSYMPWQIIHRKSESLVPRIRTQLKPFVLHSHIHIVQYNTHFLLHRENVSTVQVKSGSPELVIKHTYRS